MRPKLRASARRSRGLRRLGKRSERGSAALARALLDVDGDSASESTRELGERIEARRMELLASPEEIETPVREYTGDESDDRVDRRTVSEVCRTDSKSQAWCWLLAAVVRELRPKTALELGSGLGISTAYQAAALEPAEGAQLISLEASSVRAALAQQTIEHLGLASRAQVRHGRFTDLLPALASELSPIDYAFIDGHHDEDATIAYWATVAPHLHPEALVILDDIRWSEGMRRSWERISADPLVGAAVDLGEVGALALASSGRSVRIEIPV